MPATRRSSLGERALRLLAHATELHKTWRNYTARDGIKQKNVTESQSVTN